MKRKTEAIERLQSANGWSGVSHPRRLRRPREENEAAVDDDDEVRRDAPAITSSQLRSLSPSSPLLSSYPLFRISGFLRAPPSPSTVAPPFLFFRRDGTIGRGNYGILRRVVAKLSSLTLDRVARFQGDAKSSSIWTPRRGAPPRETISSMVINEGQELRRDSLLFWSNIDCKSSSVQGLGLFKGGPPLQE